MSEPTLPSEPTDLRAELAEHAAAPHDPQCILCYADWPCEASRALAALDAAEQERDEAKSQAATLVEALVSSRTALRYSKEDHDLSCDREQPQFDPMAPPRKCTCPARPARDRAYELTKAALGHVEPLCEACHRDTAGPVGCSRHSGLSQVAQQRDAKLQAEAVAAERERLRVETAHLLEAARNHAQFCRDAEHCDLPDCIERARIALSDEEEK